MDTGKGESPEGIGSVKAAISLYGQRFNIRNQKNSPSKSGELHLAKLDIGRFNETKKSAEKEKARAKSDLNQAKSLAKELALEIKQSNAKAKAWQLELRSMRKVGTDDRDYSKVMEELSNMKQERSRLKLDVNTALESKVKAEKEIEALNSKLESYMSTMEELSKEIETANEEHVLVELARIEAERELREIEDQRRAEAARFTKETKMVKEKIKAVRKEAKQTKELERKLAVTNSDLSVLQSEMEFVRAMESNFQNGVTEDSERSSLSKTSEDELKATKKELVRVKEEGFQFMASMDVLRKELIAIIKEADHLKKQERKADSTIHYLNSKLLKARAKLESASVAADRAKTIVANLSAALQQLQMEIETSKKEKEMIIEENNCIRLEIGSNQLKTGSTEDRLRAAIVDLEAVKISEAVALKKLREVTERTMKNRASASLKCSNITISKCEFEYLNERAASVKEVADKKVEAAQAWIEALKVEEKEIAMRSEAVQKEIKELRIAEEQTLCKIEEALADQKTNGNRIRNEEEELSNFELVAEPPRKSMKENGIAAVRRSKARRSSISPGIRNSARSPSFSVKKRTKVMPSFAKFLTKQSVGKQK